MICNCHLGHSEVVPTCAFYCNQPYIFLKDLWGERFDTPPLLIESILLFGNILITFLYSLVCLQEACYLMCGRSENHV